MPAFAPPMSPALIASCRSLLADLDGLADTVATAIRSREPYYASHVSREELVRANRANLRTLLGHLIGDPAVSFTAPRETGRLRAEEGAPLAVVLRAYRIGAQTVWTDLMSTHQNDPEALRDLLDVSSQLWSLIDLYSEALTAGYKQVAADRAVSDQRAREAALAELLAGGSAEGGRVWDLADRLHLPRSASFVVVAAEAAGPAEAARADLLPRLERTLCAASVRSVWRTEADGTVALIALAPRFDLTNLLKVLRQHSCARVGVSAVFHELHRASDALTQARQAVRAGTPGSAEVTGYDRSSVAVLIASEPAIARTILGSCLGAVMALPERERDGLLETVRTWLDHDGSVIAAAEHLGCHRNTVANRLARVAELTGRTLSSPVTLAELYLSFEALRLGHPG